jgi:hypothetical protein
MFGVGIALTGVALEVGTWDSFFATSSEERSEHEPLFKILVYI